MSKNSSIKKQSESSLAQVIRFNTFRGARSKTPKARDLSWPQVCAEIKKLARAQARDKRELPAINFCDLDGRNEDVNVRSITALPIDIDHGDVPATYERAEALGLSALIYTSPSHPNEDGSDRFRVIVPLTEPIDPEHAYHARFALAEMLGLEPGQGVEGAKAASQVFFVGRIEGDPDRDVFEIEGSPVDAAELVNATLRHTWQREVNAATVKTLEPVRIEDPDERTAALINALEPLWEEPGTAINRRDTLRALAGYLARRGWTDEQIAAVGRALPTLRDDAIKVGTMLECAQATRTSDGEVGAGWNGLVQWSPDAAAVIESISRDPEEPSDWRGVWSPAWKALTLGFARAAEAHRKTRAPDPGASAFAPPENDNAETLNCIEQRADMGNARRLVRLHGHKLRYFEARKLWYVWDGKHWKPDNTGEIVRAAKDAAESLWVEAREIADDDKRKAAYKWAAQCQDRTRLMNMIELAKSEPGIPVVAGDLDAHPWLLNVQNGTLDLRTGDLHAPDPQLLMTKCCATNYDASARSELWEAFVRRTTGGDAELAAYIQRSLGYALFGAWREKAFWFGYGPPDGAKSTLLGAIGDVLGDYHVAAAASTWMVQNNVGGNRGDVTRLLGARFVTSLEIRPGLRFDEELVKKVTGGDTIVAAGKYENEIQFPPTFALWMGANDRPTIRDDDEGMWSRMRCVPFTNPVPDDEKDPHLREKLTSSEHAPAVLAWLVAGCLAWQRKGIGNCLAVTTATKAYRADMNRAGAFFEECCELGESFETPAKAMRLAYDDWCKANGVRNPLAANALGQRLRALGATGGDDSSRKVVQAAAKAAGQFPARAAVKDRFWFGVRLRRESD